MSAFIQFTVPGRLHGLNEYIDEERCNRFLAARMKRSDMALVRVSIKDKKKLRTPVYICYRFFEKNRRRDKDNISGWAHKVVQDALIQAGVIPNDGWAELDGYQDTFFVDSKNPRIEIVVFGAEETHGAR